MNGPTRGNDNESHYCRVEKMGASINVVGVETNSSASRRVWCEARRNARWSAGPDEAPFSPASMLPARGRTQLEVALGDGWTGMKWDG